MEEKGEESLEERRRRVSMRKGRRNMARKGVKEEVEERCTGGRKEGKRRGEVWRRKGRRVLKEEGKEEALCKDVTEGGG